MNQSDEFEQRFNAACADIDSRIPPESAFDLERNVRAKIYAFRNILRHTFSAYAAEAVIAELEKKPLDNQSKSRV